MNLMGILPVLLLYFGKFSNGLSRNVSERPAVVDVGAIFSFKSTIGRVARVAIEEAVKDVNSDSRVLPGTKFRVQMENSNCSGFLGMVGALQLMQKEIVAIIGPQSSVVAHAISNVANELQVPLLSFAATDPTLSSLQFPFFVRTTQSDQNQMKAVADVIGYFGWRQVIAIFLDDDGGRNGVSALDDALALKRCRVVYKAGIPPGDSVTRGDIMDILVKVALMESRVIVLHAYPALGFMIFSVANYLGMMGDGYVWIATDWLSSILDSSFAVSAEVRESMQGVLTLRQHVPETDKKRTFISRWRNATGGLFGLNSYAYYAYDTVWLLAHALESFFSQGGAVSFSSDPRLRSSAEAGKLHLEYMRIFDGGSLLLKNIVESDFVGLTGLVKFDSDRALLLPSYDLLNVIGTGIRLIGYWSNYSGLTALPPERLYSVPVNRSSTNQKLYSIVWPGQTVKTPRGWVFPNKGKQLRIGVPNRVSYKEFVSQVPGTNITRGFCIDVFTAAINLMPYAVPFEFVPFGDGLKNPSYTELVRLITTGYFDGVVGDVAIVTNRTRIVDFTQPYASSGLVVVAPFKTHNTGAWAFLRPFSLSLWGVTAGFFVVVGVAVWILEHRMNDEFRGPPKKQLITILWFSLSTLFFAHRETTVSALGRMVLVVWLFVVLIVNSSYTASLTSILTVQQLSSHVKGIETLRQSNDPIGYQVGSFAERYLTEELGISGSRLVALGSPEAYARALLLGPEKKGGVAAVVDERPYVELFLSSQCEFRIVGPEFTKSGWGFAFRRDSPLAVDVSTAILALSEDGDLQRIHDKWLTKTACSLESTEINPNRLHLRSFWGLFLICGIACFFTLCVYFFKTFRRFKEAIREENMSECGGSSGGSRSRSLQRFLSVMDEKKDPTKSKKRKMEGSVCDEEDFEEGRNPRGGGSHKHLWKQQR